MLIDEKAFAEAISRTMDAGYKGGVKEYMRAFVSEYEAAKAPATGQPVELSGVLQAHNDDCVSACVAMLFGYSLADIPRFDAIDWHEQLCEWLNVRGYGLVNISFTGEQKDGIPSGYTIGAISSQLRDGWKHCVICLDGMIVWDPKTGKQDGNKRAEEYTIIYPLNFTPLKREAINLWLLAALKDAVHFIRNRHNMGRGTREAGRLKVLANAQEALSKAEDQGRRGSDNA